MAFKISYLLRAKHGVLREALLKKGWSQKRAAKFLGITQSQFGDLVNLKRVPKEPCKRLKEKLMVLTGQSWEDLFPEEIRNPKFLNARKTFEKSVEVNPALLLNQVGLLALPPQTPDEILDYKEEVAELEILISSLLPRDSACVRAYVLEGKTLEETGKEVGMSKERVRQTLAKAERTMRTRHQRRTTLRQAGLDPDKPLTSQLA